MINPNDNYVFDATQHAPETKLEPVPAGTYDVTIDDTDVKDIKDNKGWYLSVTFKITSGEYTGRKFNNNYNIGHTESAETVRIANGQLSALCNVTGRLIVTKANKGAELIGAPLRAKVANDGTYNNLKTVFDTAGNEPAQSGRGRPPASPAPVASATPRQGWGTTASAPAAAPAAPAAFPPVGWAAHPTAPGYFYKDQEVLTEADLRARMAPPAAPALPPAAPTVAATPAAAPAAWSQAPAAGGTPAAPWGNTAPGA